MSREPGADREANVNTNGYMLLVCTCQLPGDSWRGKDVLELGAGIGRFTAELAQHASSVVAVDFVEASCRVNEQTNKHFPHIKVRPRLSPRGKDGVGIFMSRVRRVRAVHKGSAHRAL